MSIWKNILSASARGDEQKVQEQLGLLMEDICFPVDSPGSLCRYGGPVPKAVLHTISTKLGEPDLSLARNRVEDFIDFVVDAVIEKVMRTSDLAKYCLLHPDQSLDAVADEFFRGSSLKRGYEQRRNFVEQHLASMLAAGVTFVTDSLAVRQAKANTQDLDELAFEELALLKEWDVLRSWYTFKKRTEIAGNFKSVETVTGGTGVSDEASDFVVLSNRQHDFRKMHPGTASLEFEELASSISYQLNSLLDEWHEKRRTDGYQPIAWHRVWWEVDAKFETLCLQIDRLEPECETDETLAGHIEEAYPEVKSPNRLKITRRRKRLWDDCNDLVVDLVRHSLVK